MRATSTVGGSSVTDVYRELVDALNRLHDETGTEALSITFSKSDVPIDWDDDSERWVALND